MAEDDPKQKMRAFDDEVALTVAPFYLVHMLQRTFPARFIAPCLPTKIDFAGGDGKMAAHSVIVAACKRHGGTFVGCVADLRMRCVCLLLQ